MLSLLAPPLPTASRHPARPVNAGGNYKLINFCNGIKAFVVAATYYFNNAGKGMFFISGIYSFG